MSHPEYSNTVTDADMHLSTAAEAKMAELIQTAGAEVDASPEPQADEEAEAEVEASSEPQADEEPQAQDEDEPGGEKRRYTNRLFSLPDKRQKSG